MKKKGQKKKTKPTLENFTLNKCSGEYPNIRESITHLHPPLFWDTLEPCPACFWYKEARKEEAVKDCLENLLSF
jgi:hypothetical protein